MHDKLKPAPCYSIAYTIASEDTLANHVDIRLAEVTLSQIDRLAEIAGPKERQVGGFDPSKRQSKVTLRTRRDAQLVHEVLTQKPITADGIVHPVAYFLDVRYPA